MRSGVYQITNEKNGKRYIGSAINLVRRKSEHMTRIKKKNHPNMRIRNSVNKHGSDSFSFKVLLICDRADVLFYEQRALDVINPEYNINPVARNCSGRIVTQETREKIRIKNTGKKHLERSIEYREKISLAHKGRKKSAEHLEKLQAGRARQIFSDARREHIANSLKIQYATGMRSRVKSDEHCAKIGKAFASLSDQNVRDIKAARHSGVSGVALAKIYSVPPSTISDIVNNKAYKWVL